MRIPRLIPIILVLFALAGAGTTFAQEPTPPAQPPAHGSPMPRGAEPQTGTEEEHAPGEEAHDGGILSLVARLFNFAVLVGTVVYFLRSPIARHLASRITQIRQELVTAEELRTEAAAQLAAIQTKMAALPGELEALRRQGGEDANAERERIARAAEQERARLLDQTRREIDMRLRVARRELTEHAARLAVQVAEQRIRRVITPDDQIRLVDRYVAQLKEAR